MPSKTEEYLALAQRTANGLTRYWESWTDYLTTASRLYKYPFADQLMIYAQRPDATACADFDIWNNRMNRYVRRGAKGIALLDESSGFPRLHYVFDVSDTGVRRCSATSFLRNWDSILEKKRANLRSISEPARLRQPPPRSTGAAHARGRAQSIREERRIAAPPVLFALLWFRLLPALYGPFCGPLRPFGGCPWGVTPPARECLPPAPPDTRRRG